VDTILSTIQFSIDMRADWVQFTAASPFIGTKLRDWAIDHGFATEDEYAYINCYESTMGNENLTREQISQLAHFAQLIGTYLVNRKGFLKENRTGWWYRPAQAVVDHLSVGMARAVFQAGKWRYERSFRNIAPASAD
jgi:hypothetical protein